MLENNRAAPQSEEDTAYPQIKCGGWSKGGSLVAVLCWMAFIFLLSAQTATESSGLSLHISKCVAEKQLIFCPMSTLRGFRFMISPCSFSR